MARTHVMTAARRAALHKAQLASARKRRGLRSKSSKKLDGRLSRARGIQEYKTRKGTKTGWATNTAPSRSFGSAMRKARKAGRHNKRLGRKQRRLDKTVNYLTYRENRRHIMMYGTSGDQIHNDLLKNKKAYKAKKKSIRSRSYGYKGPA